MGKIVSAGLASAFALTLAACSTMTPPRYSVNADNNVVLRQYIGSKVEVSELKHEGKFSANCRLMGPIEASDGRSVPQFVYDSFNDEFKFANIYGDQVPLELTVKDVKFSSTSGLTNGYWDISVTLKNPTSGKSVSASEHYTFKSGFDAITACNQTADALTPAVQELIGKTINQPGFKGLLEGAAASTAAGQ